MRHRAVKKLDLTRQLQSETGFEQSPEWGLLTPFQYSKSSINVESEEKTEDEETS